MVTQLTAQEEKQLDNLIDNQIDEAKEARFNLMIEEENDFEAGVSERKSEGMF